MKLSEPPDATRLPDEATGVPCLRSWRSVYFVVFGSFLVWVGLLALLTRMFS